MDQDRSNTPSPTNPAGDEAKIVGYRDRVLALCELPADEFAAAKAILVSEIREGLTKRELEIMWAGLVGTAIINLAGVFLHGPERFRLNAALTELILELAPVGLTFLNPQS